MMTVEDILMWIDKGLTPHIPPELWDEVQAAWTPEQRDKWHAALDSIRDSYRTSTTASASPPAPPSGQTL